MEPTEWERELAELAKTRPNGSGTGITLEPHAGAPAAIAYSRTRRVGTSRSVLRQHRIVAASEEGALTDAYKILRTQVLHRMRENRWNVLGVTSAGKQEGKTTVAINLAISLAMEGNQTVLLVDADLRAPRVHRAFGFTEGRGLVDYLLDGVPVDTLLVNPDISRFVLLPGGRPVNSSAELLASPRMLALAKELKHRDASRLVLFDLPPVLDAADALAFSPHLDAMLLIIDAGRTQAEHLERALQVLKGTPIIGTVLNKG